MVLSFPIPLRTLFAAHPQLLTPVLQVIHRAIATFMFKQVRVKLSEAHTGAVTLIQEQGARYLAGIDSDEALTSLQVTSCTYRIGLGPRAGQKVLSRQSMVGRREPSTTTLYANAHGFSLHAAVRCDADQRDELEHLCRTITRPAIGNGRLSSPRGPSGDAIQQAVRARHGCLCGLRGA